ncbi:MAG TPA: hypothetical protein VH597_11220 [Verrucomicrobiae bacterium]|jgi:hypothetical protein|nr:hypothetical protein [Verrucomicrobiae bacterium]
MKKILVRIAIVLVVLIVLVALSVHFFLDGAVKNGIETLGPKMTKVDVKLDAVSISLLSGSGKIKGLVIGNPEGYKTPHSISIGTASLALKPGTLLSDKVVITSINLEAPEITFEGGLGGNNLSKILANLNENTSGPGGTNVAGASPKEEKKAAKKLEVDDFTITGAKLDANITDLGGKTLTVPLPTIHLTNLGTGPDGITVTELTKQVISAIQKQAVETVASESGNLGKAASNLTKGLGTNASGTINNAAKGIGDLFKKK